MSRPSADALQRQTPFGRKGAWTLFCIVSFCFRFSRGWKGLGERGLVGMQACRRLLSFFCEQNPSSANIETAIRCVGACSKGTQQPSAKAWLARATKCSSEPCSRAAARRRSDRARLSGICSRTTGRVVVAALPSKAVSTFAPPPPERGMNLQQGRVYIWYYAVSCSYPQFLRPRPETTKAPKLKDKD